MQAVQSALTAASVGVQGSGWGWLGYNSTTGRLQIATKANQDPLLELVPLLGIDVWEHAYYYVYGPARAEYLKNIWYALKHTATQHQTAYHRTVQQHCTARRREQWRRVGLNGGSQPVRQTDRQRGGH